MPELDTGGLTGLGVDIARAAAPSLEKAAAKVGMKVAPGEFTEALDNFSTKHLGLAASLKGPGTDLLKGGIGTYEANVSKHFSRALQNPAAYGFNTPVADIKPSDLQFEVHKAARNETFGNHDELLAGYVNAIRQHKGDIAAENVVDALGVYFHEQQHAAATGLGHSTRLVGNLQQHYLTEDLALRPSPYKGKADWERQASQYLSMTLAYKSGLMHVSTPFNLFLDSSLSSSVKSMNHLFGNGYKSAIAQMRALNTVGEEMYDNHVAMYNFYNGRLSQLPGGSIIKFLHENIGIPGLSMIRRRSMVLFSMQGKYRAMELADTLASSKDPKVLRNAMYDLKILGLDGRKILANGLTNEDIGLAMFENTNRKMFLEGKTTRSPFFTASPMGRVVTLYHSYAAGQRNFILNTLKHDMQRGSFTQFAKDAAIIGTVFPAVGAALEAVAGLWRAKDPEEVAETFKQTEAGIISPEGYTSSEAWANKGEAMAHMMGLGIIINSYRAADRHKLLNSLMGPAVNMPIEIGQDATHAIVDRNKDVNKGPYDAKSYDPLARDLLHDIPTLGVGPWLAEHYFPTQQQLQKEKPMTARQQRAKREAEKRKYKRGY